MKLDELLRAVAKARTGLVGLENMAEQEILALEAEFTAIKTRHARKEKNLGGTIHHSRTEP